MSEKSTIAEEGDSAPPVLAHDKETGHEFLRAHRSTTSPKGRAAMLDHSTSNHAVTTAEPTIPGRANTTSKDDLLSRAKDAIEAGDQSLHEGADALALAQEDFKATQREIAEAVGKSAAWVNRLLRWRREGCPGSPFGPGSKAGRERRKRVQSTEQPAPHRSDADNTEADTQKTEAKPNSQAQRALSEFKYAVDHWLSQMDDDTKREAVEYAIAKSKVTTPCSIKSRASTR
jgi:hypothetical protein